MEGKEKETLTQINTIIEKWKENWLGGKNGIIGGLEDKGFDFKFLKRR